jgi:hypothetical protein
MPKPTIDQDVDALVKYDTFIRFLEFIKTLREEQIADMHEADSAKLQQISGRILSYDQILEMTDYESHAHLANLY